MAKDADLRVLPFIVPHMVLLDRPLARGAHGVLQPVVTPIGEVPAATLATLCDDFRRGVFLVAGTADPAGPPPDGAHDSPAHFARVLWLTNALGGLCDDEDPVTACSALSTVLGQIVAHCWATPEARLTAVRCVLKTLDLAEAATNRGAAPEAVQ